jgi:hypothetical protein
MQTAFTTTDRKDTRTTELLKYKYNPDDFEGMSFLPDDMRAFYTQAEVYNKDKTEANDAMLYTASIDLFFSIKHRAVEGCITKEQAREMQNYFKGIYDWHDGKYHND